MIWWERHQVLLYIAAIAAGALGGLILPGLSHPLGFAIDPVLGSLMYAIFLGVPFTAAAQVLGNWRFVAAILVLNFALVPIVVFGLSRFVQGEVGLLIGVLLVLLTPLCELRDRILGASGRSAQSSSRSHSLTNSSADAAATDLLAVDGRPGCR
jgi:ACR3 family arsenite efflux pump ArsB